MRLELVTWLEVIGTIAGLLFLGAIGKVVTPSSPAHTTYVVPTPERIIEEARVGYQVETCVRDISPQAVLSDSMSGTPELVVLEGAPVTECFPGLSEFISGGIHGDRADETTREDRAFGSPVATSVVVLPLQPQSPLEASAPLSTTTLVVVEEKESVSMATSSQAVAVPSIPTGGGSGGGASPSPQAESFVPSLDRFEECRVRLFGDVIPTAVTPEENTAFEACLSEGAL